MSETKSVLPAETPGTEITRSRRGRPVVQACSGSTSP
jgi:hypothetical protein